MKQAVRFVPVTPAGSSLAHLAARTEEAAWSKLMADASHMPYRTVDEFKRRGYSVEQWGSETKQGGSGQ